MSPAPKTPNAITGKEFLILKSINAAIRAPVHAPVPGNGTATITNNPNSWYFLILSDFVRERFSILTTIFLVYLNFSKNPSILLMKYKINGIGSMFPKKHTIKAVTNGTSLAAAKMIPPRSSRIGSIDMKNAIIASYIYSTSFLLEYLSGSRRGPSKNTE